MTWFSKIFPVKNQINSEKTNYPSIYFEGKKAFQIGKELFLETTRNNSLSTERRKQKITACLEFLDKAIENGYDEVEAFSLRGTCLRDLNYDLDAIEDFDKCIELEPERADFYYNRALAKQYIYDLEGGLEDYKKAIEFSKLENGNTRFWNNYAKETGFESATHRYEYSLLFLQEDLESAKTSFTMQARIKNKRNEIKRRIK